MGKGPVGWGREAGKGSRRIEEGGCGSRVRISRGVNRIGVVDLLRGVGGVGGTLVRGCGGGMVGDRSAAVAGVVRGHFCVKEGVGATGLRFTPSLAGKDVLRLRDWGVEAVETLLRVGSR